PMAAPQSELVQTTVSEEDPTQQALPEPKHEERTRDEPATSNDDERGKGNFERVRQYLADHPDAKVREVAKALTVSVSTANKWMIRIRGECLPRE
ncbi:MAG TPA: hypothetical protein VKB35_08960, partial [Ktedonobacteraceae bacterium]|nr:hypothetical protein [Ktedonobacteraceae bacterium]